MKASGAGLMRKDNRDALIRPDNPVLMRSNSLLHRGFNCYNSKVFLIENRRWVKPAADLSVPEHSFWGKSSHGTEFRVFFSGKIAVGAVAV